MPELRKELLRASARIRERLLAPGSGEVFVCLPDYHWGQCVETARQLERVLEHGWQAAAKELRRRLTGDIRSLHNALQDLLREIEAPATPLVASQRDIFEDLLALEDEFDELEVDLKEQTLSVTTDPIVLEQRHLGRFQIILRWANLGDSCPYRVVATDTDCAATSRDETPHPHVEGDSLCEGEAKVPIRQALKQGRLFDFFTIVRQTLMTYNAGSAYVRLSHWHGVECSDCGCSMNEEERRCCEGCDEHVCGDCTTCCYACDEYRCNQCIETCSLCEESFCKSCLSRCSHCKHLLCKECLDDGRCDNCREPADNLSPNPEDLCIAAAAAPQPAVAAIHAHRLGQTAVSARRRRH